MSSKKRQQESTSVADERSGETAGGAATAAAAQQTAKRAKQGGGGGSGSAAPLVVCGTGANGGRSHAQTLLRRALGDDAVVVDYEIVGSKNLTSAKREAACAAQLVEAARAAVAAHGSDRPLVLLGHSFSSRLNLHTCALPDARAQLPPSLRAFVCAGYPVVHPRQQRDAVIVNAPVPAGVRVLFLCGERDKTTSADVIERACARSSFADRATVTRITAGDHSLTPTKKKAEQCDAEIVAALQSFFADFL